jgi:hypothetical protein
MVKKSNIYLNDLPLHSVEGNAEGDIIDLEGGKFYKISGYDRMDPFFMSLTGAGDHWMFISSNGALTAGRRDPANSLFPYSTDDKVTDSAGYTGSKTILRIFDKDREFLWEPFSVRYERAYHIQRNLYKSIYGNILIFEEINHSLSLTFSYSWQFSNEYGFVKTSKIRNSSSISRSLLLLDGLQNIMPYGVREAMQMQYSTLVDAYKKNELDPASGIGIFYLSSIPTDKAEPSEGLKATTVWSAGLSDTIKLLSASQLDAFRQGIRLKQEEDIRARRGAYFISGELTIKGQEEKKWIAVAGLEQDRENILTLADKLGSSYDMMAEVSDSLNRDSMELMNLVAKADGLQKTGDELADARSFSNVMYNCMRGGIFGHAYSIQRKDLTAYIHHFNKKLGSRFCSGIESIFPENIQHIDLLKFAEQQGDSDLLRLCYEYLPLTFSRRHGDPSRPWNRFYINNQNPDGTPRMDYQGNWRDIFQNWEALAYSFPEYTEGMIFRFLNASTADGYNPYRIMKDGIEWEVIDPDDPWSNIGYWGDHQIVYLLKLMEVSERFHPGKLGGWLTSELFVYTDVPYRIKSYTEKLANPRETIDYDGPAALATANRVKEYGADGKLVHVHDQPYKVSLAEKLLVPVLAKISNLVAGGGIWMNTQRPEWNDANNALVGNGLSMVTVYYLRRHVSFIRSLLSECKNDSVELSAEVAQWLNNVHESFNKNKVLLKGKISTVDRRVVLDEMGAALDIYLTHIYKSGFSGRKTAIALADLTGSLTLFLEYIDATISSGRRQDKLYHTYNLMSLDHGGGIVVTPLYEMLEGQVAILSCGYLDTDQSLELMDALRKSSMYRDDQKSYMLYPDRRLPGFMEKNRIDAGKVEHSELLRECLRMKDYSLVKPDSRGSYQFNGALKNAADLLEVLERLKLKYSPEQIGKERNTLVALFEQTFNHHTFTGRSGTFFKYEGLGSIYWHMVSKLLLAIQEVCIKAIASNEPENKKRELKEFYIETREGLGLHKSPENYGAFPTDPYSHTPGHTGVQQPGMTGQVKEDILSRWSELGIQIRGGKVCFEPGLLQRDQFLAELTNFEYLAADGARRQLAIPRKALAFTFNQVPFIYHLSGSSQLKIYKAGGSMIEENGNVLPENISAELFRRTGTIARIEVFIQL